LVWFGASTAPLLSESALDDAYLSRGRSLGLSRLLWEIGLDSGYFSRHLCRLEADRLVTTDPDDSDGRVRKVRLTREGLAEREVLDSSSNELAASILTPLTEPQRDRLGCGALKLHIDTQIAEVKRMWVASDVRALDWGDVCWNDCRRRPSHGEW
jgi:DNA-binding MarR family transcriptional regulator